MSEEKPQNAPVPFDRVIWDAGEVADYLHQSRAHFLKTARYAPGFPKPITTGKERPKWRAIQVTSWRLGLEADE